MQLSYGNVSKIDIVNFIPDITKFYYLYSHVEFILFYPIFNGCKTLLLKKRRDTIKKNIQFLVRFNVFLEIVPFFIVWIFRKEYVP